MIGPIGLDKVFTATAHAAKNPMAVPSTVGQYWDRTIQRRQRAIRATSTEARIPPRIPPRPETAFAERMTDHRSECAASTTERASNKE